ncbi:MAG: FtsX-like permease family protein [Bacteroidetes bacterium]|jgi:putative ABC transport system permease protein|nr:FtsX-like permease family protein [Bacteroidota bacterium]
MLRNYLTTALRTLRRRPGFTALNIAGLALGLACCLSIGLYVQHELSYDQHHGEAERIFRVVQNTDDEGTAWVGGAMAPLLAEDFPQIEEIVRFHRANTPMRRPDEQQVVEVANFIYADSTAFNVFNFPLVQGDPETALARPGTVVLTEEAAARHFGDEDPMGQALLAGERELTVTGVMKDLPATTHMAIDMMTSLATFKLNVWGSAESRFTSFWWPSTYTYALLKEDASAPALAEQLPDFIQRHRDPKAAAAYVPALQPLTDIHLRAGQSGDWTTGGNIATVVLFGGIAVFILLLACVNFMNLTTARAAERANEVGVRKAMGAGRGQLMGQFFGEALLLSSGATLLAIGITAAALPAFRDLAARELAWPALGDPFWALMAAAVGLTGLVAGSYPALYLSRFQAAEVLKQQSRTRVGGAAWLRRGLVVFQFAVSVALIAGTAIAYQQLSFLQTADLGFDKEALVAVDFNGGEQFETMTQQFERTPGVQAVTVASGTPGIGGIGNPRIERAPFTPPEQLEQAGTRTQHQMVGFGYFEMLGIETLAGRTFSEDRPADLGQAIDTPNEFGDTSYDGRAFVINRSMAEAQGWTPDEALGKALRVFTYENGNTYTDHRGTVIGVVENYHARPLYEEIEPMVFEVSLFPSDDGSTTYVNASRYLVKLAPGSAAAAMDRLEAAWNEVRPNAPFEASFVDAALDAQYRAEQRLGQLIGLFSGLAIVIACLGLFGLAAYTAQQRTKEIGIRKALGASLGGLVVSLSKEFVALVGIAILVAVPLAYFGMQQWLQTFAYRIDVGLGTLVAAGAIALVIALVTVSTQTYRAARIDPAKALRSE